MTDLSPGGHARRLHVAESAAAVAAAISLLGLAGQALGIDALTRLEGGWVAIRPATAVALLCLAASLLLDGDDASPGRRRSGSALAGAAALLGLVGLLEWGLHTGLLIDRLLVPAGAAGPLAGRMAVTTAACLLLLGTARVAGASRLRAAAEAGAVLVGLMAGLVLVSYAFGVAPVERANYVPMAVDTALAVLALSVGVVARRPDALLVRAFAAEPPGGSIARMLPALVAAELLLAWLEEAGEHTGMFSDAFGDAVQVVSSVVLLGAIVLWGAGRLNRAERRRREAEEGLRENEERLRAVFENAGVGLAYVAPDGHLIQINRRLCEILGYAPEELLSRSFQDITHPDHVATDEAQRVRMARGQLDTYTTDKRYLRKDGSAVWVGLTSSAVRGSGGELAYFVAAFAEIGERRSAEDRLRQSEAEYRRLVDHAPVGIYRSSAAGRFLTVNPALVSMLGYGSTEEVLGLDLFHDVYVEPGARDVLTSVAAGGGVPTREVEWRRKDGRHITVRLSMRAVRDADGRVEFFEGLGEDVTQQHVLETQFRQAQRLEAVGRLAGGVAHDFNNVLTAITGYTELLLEELPAGDPKREDVQEIRAAAGRAAGLTRQLLAFSRKQVLQARVLDLNALIETLQRMLQRLIGEDVRLEAALAPGLGAVRADPGQLEQVVLNLAVNARDAMPNGGRLTIETADVVLGADYVREHPTVQPGRYVMLAVSDTGTGMDAETRAHLFEPFFTTKELGKGTGLGLATVYGIVQQSGGHIWVYSEPGRGATFKIYLPRVDAPVETGQPAQAVAVVEGGGETVLLAEDDPSVREVTVAILAHKGYRVLRAPDGQTALELARGHGGEIPLLVTDIIMPGMTGRELAEALARERPGVRTLYISGYTDDAVIRHGVLEAGTPYLQKPFTPDDLARKVREVIDRA
jgi:PAS domain S-box-containing protein